MARRHDLSSSEAEASIDLATRDPEDGVRSGPKKARERYEADLKETREAIGDAQLPIRAVRTCTWSLATVQTSRYCSQMPSVINTQTNSP